MVCNPTTTCPTCPTLRSLKTPQTFTCTMNLPTQCRPLFTTSLPALVGKCVPGFTRGTCQQAVPVTICGQTLECCVNLDWIRVTGNLELTFNISGALPTACPQTTPTPVVFSCVSRIPVDELCFYCGGQAPITPNICNAFTVIVTGFDATTGVITFTVQFTCPPTTT